MSIQSPMQSYRPFLSLSRACRIFGMLRKCRSLGLPIDIQLKMFDTMVYPILLYGCEVWGYENNAAVESFFLC